MTSLKAFRLCAAAVLAVLTSPGCIANGPEDDPEAPTTEQRLRPDGLRTIRETGYLSCAPSAACEAGVACLPETGTAECVALPAACGGQLTCACAGAALCGEATRCADHPGGIVCGGGTVHPGPLDAAPVLDAGPDVRDAIPALPPDAQIVPDARLDPDASEAPGCPATGTWLDIGARPFDPADGRYLEDLVDKVTEFEGSVVAVEPGRLTLQPASETWQVTLQFPEDVHPGLAPGDPVSVRLGLKMPFWEEAAFSVYGPAGLALLAVHGELGWLNEPKAYGPEVSLSLRGDC